MNWYFIDQLNETTDANKEEENLFAICINAEKIPASLEEYRQKLFHLQRLDAEICKKYFKNSQIQEVKL